MTKEDPQLNDSGQNSNNEHEKQDLHRGNILVAGNIDYVYELGEHMGIFKLVDVLILN